MTIDPPSLQHSSELWAVDVVRARQIWARTVSDLRLTAPDRRLIRSAPRCGPPAQAARAGVDRARAELGDDKFERLVGQGAALNDHEAVGFLCCHA